MARVLVTRPQPGASATAERLRALGHEPIVLPLSEIHWLDPSLHDVAGTDAVAATSANAFRHMNREDCGTLLGKPCFTVGGRTATAARKTGFQDVRTSDADAPALARLIAADLPPQSRILYLCGRIRRPEFEAQLQAAGMICQPVETYDTVFPPPDAKAIETLSIAPPHFVLLYSARSAEAVRAILSPPDLEAAFRNARFLCLSRAVARALGTLGEGRTYWNEQPDEEALFSLLAQP